MDSKIRQKDFENMIKKFYNLEDSRDQLWGRAQCMIKKGFEVESYILILSTWNFARFRFIVKTFKIEKFLEAIQKTNPVFERIKNKRFEELDFRNEDTMLDIKFIYTELKKIAEQTGATKIMALKNSNLFVMWDTEIRKMYKIGDGASAEDYLEFLKKMQYLFSDIKIKDKKKTLAKAIDEYNYVLAEERRLKNRR